MHYRYNEKTLSLSRMLQEKDQLHAAFVEETKSLQRQARQNLQRVLEEHDKLNCELENRKRKLDEWSRELNKREVLTEREKQKLDEDKRKNEAINSSYQLASIEQKKTDENVLRLVEEQKREKEEALNKILKLEMELDIKQKLEMEIQELKGKLKVMEHLGDDSAVQKKVEEMKAELEEKIEELKDSEDMNTGLMVKERECNDEIQDARKELLAGMIGLLGGRNIIGIKRMGDIDEKAFLATCKQRFPPDEAQIQATTLCSLWQENLKDSQWHPFTFKEINGKTEVVGWVGPLKVGGISKRLPTLSPWLVVAGCWRKARLRKRNGVDVFMCSHVDSRRELLICSKHYSKQVTVFIFNWDLSFVVIEKLQTEYVNLNLLFL
ncbi:hypothetical protein ACFE04_016147 [Oxalis oulophora]